MQESQYLPDFDRFIAEHPEIDSKTIDLLEPSVVDSKEALFNFIMSGIFM